MSDPTPLDHAHRTMRATPDDSAPRMRYFGALSSTELFLLLEGEAEDGRIAPRVFDLDEGPVVLAFDTESRLSGFTGAVTPFAALPGRALAGLLAGQGIGLAINPGSETAEILPAEAVLWWAETLAPPPDRVAVRPEALVAPGHVAEPLLAALAAGLAGAGAAGLAERAWLVGLSYGAGEGGLLLAVSGARDEDTPALAGAVAEALRFSGLDAAAVDVAFLAPGDPALERIARVGLRLELAPPEPAPEPAAAPPSDRQTMPPRLR